MNKGMTLLELMIVLSIIAISIMFTLPTFSELTHSYHYKTASLMLNNDLRYAKLVANRQKLRVSICISIDQLTCLTEPSTHWHQGWIIFLDPKNNFTPEAQNIIRYRQPMHSSVKIYSSFNIQNGVQFNVGQKIGHSLGSGLPNGYFMICGQPKHNAQKLILNVYGRLRKEQLSECEF